MRRFIQNSILAFTAWAALTLPAAAGEEHNPLDKLKKKEVCTAARAKTFDGGTTMLVSRQDILKAAIGSNALPPPRDFSAATSFIYQLADAIVPCREQAQPASTDPRTEIPLPDEELTRREAACNADAALYQLSEKDRYKGDALAIRHNLLRFFQASIHGGTKEFTPARSEEIAQAGYQPLINRSADDQVLLEFLLAPEDKTNFRVYCPSPRVTASGTSETTDKYIVAGKAAGDAGAGWLLFQKIFKKVESKSEEIDPYVPNEADTSKRFADTAAVRQESARQSLYPDVAGEPKVNFSLEKTPSYQLVIAKDADQFIKAERAGAEFGTTNPSSDSDVINSGNIEFTADAAIGLHFRWDSVLTGTPDFPPKPADGECKDTDTVPQTQKCARATFKSNWSVGVTPYVGISQESQTMKVYAADDKGVFGVRKKKLDYATLMYGIRMDLLSSDAGTPLKGDQLRTAKATYTVGTNRPGVGVGGYWEYINDNYNILSARKVGAYFSPPAYWFGSGWLGNSYGRPYRLDVGHKGRDSGIQYLEDYRWYDDAFAGWYLKWEGKAVMEDLDHIRLPRDFEKPPCYTPSPYACEVQRNGEIWIRKSADDIVTGPAYGTDLSIALSRYELFGLGKDDLFVEFKASWIHRQELDQDNSADRWKLSLKFQDPLGSEARFWKIEYEKGEDYVAATENESVSLKIVLAN